MKKWSQIKKYVVGTGVVLLITVLVWYTKREEGVMSENRSLVRKEHGMGEYEAELILEIDGAKQSELMITVPEQHLTVSEEELYLALAIEEIRESFVGENPSLEAIKEAVFVSSVYQEGKVLADWEFSNPGLIAVDGTIDDAVMQKDKEQVMATVYLTCEDSSLIHEFGFTVCKKEKGEEEVFYEKLHQFIAESGEKEGTELLLLPTEINGHILNWKNKESRLPIQIFLLGMVIVFLLPALEKERDKEAKDKRQAQLTREYSDMVNKLALLLGAGMTLQGAWRQITKNYSEERIRKHGGERIVYEEMLIAQREIENGKGEIKAYEAFGERCELQKYRKLSSYLVQNLKKGNKGLCELLEKEAAEAFAERKNLAQQLGEEVGTKLLFPMLLMLGIVILIIMIPAILSFETGIS